MVYNLTAKWQNRTKTVRNSQLCVNISNVLFEDHAYIVVYKCVQFAWEEVISALYKATPVSGIRHIYTKRVDLCMSSLQLVGYPIYQTTKIEINYSSLNRELSLPWDAEDVIKSCMFKLHFCLSKTPKKASLIGQPV